MITLTPEQFGSYAEAATHEWIVTNGIGGYASGTVAGSLTRTYHGYLVAATAPPLGRTLMLTKLDETASFGEFAFPLFSNAWRSGVREALNLTYLTGFRLEGTTPVWTFEREGMRLEKRIWMAQGENTTYVRYDLLACPEPLHLDIKTMINYRSHHTTTHAEGWTMTIDKEEHGIRVTAHPQAVPFSVMVPGATCTAKHEWYRNYDLAVERYRGLTDMEDHLYAARFQASIEPGASLLVAASTEEPPQLDAEEEEDLSTEVPEAVEQLAHATAQMIVTRPMPDDGEGRTVIAGYHWFGDWGRDTMIALPGLTLFTGREQVAERILRTYAGFVDEGMLPNRFGMETPEYNTVDATLWYFEAIRAYHKATGDDQLVSDLFTTLADIITWHIKGTRYGIQVDETDGLLRAGEEGIQLTWMDAKVDEWVVTPRIGKPVEVNALWYNALRIMASFAELVGEDPQPYTDAADLAAESFEKFWADEYNYLYDVLESPGKDGGTYADGSLRPNQIFAVSLPHSPLDAERQKAVVDAVGEHLLTARGLRTLSPHDADYKPTYGGSRRSRDGAYHQGTVWPWLIGPFVRAHLRVYEDKPAARAFVTPLIESLPEGALGTLNEIYDGDAPHAPRGAIAQAWSVAEVLRAWFDTQ